jgi:hypothetical protein
VLSVTLENVEWTYVSVLLLIYVFNKRDDKLKQILLLPAIKTIYYRPSYTAISIVSNSLSRKIVFLENRRLVLIVRAKFTVHHIPPPPSYF